MERYLSFVEIGCKIQFYCQFSTDGNYPKFSDTQVWGAVWLGLHCLFTFYIEKIASYTIKTGFVFCFLEMLRKKWISP